MRIDPRHLMSLLAIAGQLRLRRRVVDTTHSAGS